MRPTHISVFRHFSIPRLSLCECAPSRFPGTSAVQVRRVLWVILLNFVLRFSPRAV
uniref:Uncharacterized protein n=1 Tax=Anguilla anguilla TaxID=7936 RepID=A0A0E9QWB3_ANGAN